MKTAIIFIALLSLSLVSAAFTQQDRDKAGILPGTGLSPLYTIAINLQEVPLLWKNGVEHARYKTELAEQRLLEAQILIEDGKEEESQTSLAEGNRLTIEADDELTKNLNLVDVAENAPAIKEIKDRLAHREEVLKGIIERFRTDTNPNNDHALSGLSNALVHSEQFTARQDNLRTAVNKDLSDHGLPTIDQVNAQTTPELREVQAKMLADQVRIKNERGELR